MAAEACPSYTQPNSQTWLVRWLFKLSVVASLLGSKSEVH
ncbi:hypothetical protein GGR62_003840 [Xanthomonas campestris]|nr:hypothetical protein [Xanthomonas sp. 3075]